MFQEIKVTLIDSNEWKLPFNFAIGLHLLLILSTIYGPEILRKKPLFPDIYTIDLINISDTQVKTPVPIKVAKPASAVQPEKVEEVKVEPPKAVTIPEPPDAIKAVPVITKPISIKPLKRKKIKQRVTKPAVQPKKNLEKIHRKHLNEVKESERLAQEAAKLAAMEAVSHLKQMLQESNTYDSSNQPDPEKPTGSAQVRTNSNVIESQHFASIINKLQPFWSLPEYKVWDPELVAIIVIQVEKNGIISKQFFEQKSGDRLFDQFVLKTLQEGSPLPPIPAALQKDRLEIGLRFRPGGIQ